MLTYKQSDITTAAEDIVVNAANGIGKIGIIHAVTMLITGWWTREKIVRKLLPKVMELAREHGAKSIAIQYMGCGTGWLKQIKVERIYQEFFAENVNDIKVTVYYL